MTTTIDTLPRLRRIRLGVRLTLTLGVAASIAANVLHADPNLISQAIAAWAPLALLLSVELISRVPVHRRGHATIRLGATIIIAGIAAWVSYWHMVAVTTRYGETGLTPYLLPISVDGLIVVASISLVEVGGRIRHHGTTDHPHTTQAPTPPASVAASAGVTTAGTNPPALISQARLVANAHYRATGTHITPADLAGRMRISQPEAGRLLAAIGTPTAGATPAGQPPPVINGTPVNLAAAAEADR